VLSGRREECRKLDSIMMSTVRRSALVLAVLFVVAACTQQRESTEEGSEAAADDPYPGINSLAEDRGLWQQLLSDHAAIRRVVRFTNDGVEAETTSSDPEVAARIRAHADGMAKRMKVGGRVRVWDPVFQELFDRHADVTLAVSEIEGGVRIVERANDPEVVALLWSHAAGVNDFVREGHPANRRETRRIPVGPPPPGEIAIGGVQHRILLGQPDERALEIYAASGATGIVNFRTEGDMTDFDERSCASSLGLRYTSISYAAPSGPTSAMVDAALAVLRSDDASVLVLHGRTGNGVGPSVAVWRVLDGGVPVEQAIAEAKAMGMTSPAMEAFVREELRRRSGARAW
jgi:hypothetical protein